MSREYVALRLDTDSIYYFSNGTLWVTYYNLTNGTCNEYYSCYGNIEEAIKTEAFGRGTWTLDPKEINKYLMTWELMK